MEPLDWSQQGVDDQHSHEQTKSEQQQPSVFQSVFQFEKYAKHPIEGAEAFPLPVTSWWNYSSPLLLAEYERLMLSAVKGHIEHAQVLIEEDPKTQSKVYINTIKLSKKSGKDLQPSATDEPHETELKLPTSEPSEHNKGDIPLVMLHGFAASIGFWLYNLDALSEYTTVYAIDWVGFGRSSRKPFVLSEEAKNDASGKLKAKEAEDYFLSALEKWREVMKIDKFIILGHSMGAYLAANYTLRFPNRIAHLIMADPWGVPVKPENPDYSRVPLKWKIIGPILVNFNPLASVRALGPFGVSAIKKVRTDIINKFAPVFGEKSAEIIAQYIFQSNAITPCSGEDAFVALTIPFAWAVNPLARTLLLLDKNIPATLFYGDISWMDKNHGYELKKNMPADSKMEVHIISDSGHHIYADNYSEFNLGVQKILSLYSSSSSSSPSL